MPIPRSLFEAVSACPSPILPSMILIAFLGLPLADSGAWAAATLTDGRAAPASDLRDISASGPRETRWTTQPTPYAGNPTDHQGRPAGSYDDGGRGRISGEILADETGRALPASIAKRLSIPASTAATRRMAAPWLTTTMSSRQASSSR